MTAPAELQPDSSAPRMPDLLYSETENELRAAVRDLLDDRCRLAGGAGQDRDRASRTTLRCGARWPPSWAAPGCSSPRASGGAGASLPGGGRRGRGDRAGPWPRCPTWVSAVVATAALLAAAATNCWPGWPGQADRRAGRGVRPHAARVRARCAARRAGRRAAAGCRAAGRPAGQARLTGTVTGVADALPADVLLVPADGVPFGLYAVRGRGRPGSAGRRWCRWT